MGAIDPEAATQDGELLVDGVDHRVEALGRYHRDPGFDSFVFWPSGAASSSRAACP
jgi:hypothetical protein